MISVIIPAHNEAPVIRCCLSALLAGARPGELEILVVCNGCSDRTAERARSFGPPVSVLETPIASKVHALNLGDAAATAFPRFYVDADIVLSLTALRALAQCLDQGTVLAVAPTPKLDLTRASRPVQAFYAIDALMPSRAEGIGGSGVYGLSEAGRRRFGQFPLVTADDGFVRLSFTPDERRTLANAVSLVTPPTTLRGLITIKTRSHLGSYELQRLHPSMWANRGRCNGPALRALARQPRLWPELIVYLSVKMLARFLARRRLRGSAQRTWERDDTSRQTSAQSLDPISSPSARSSHFNASAGA